MNEKKEKLKLIVKTLTSFLVSVFLAVILFSFLKDDVNVASIIKEVSRGSVRGVETDSIETNTGTGSGEEDIAEGAVDGVEEKERGSESGSLAEEEKGNSGDKNESHESDENKTDVDKTESVLEKNKDTESDETVTPRQNGENKKVEGDKSTVKTKELSVQEKKKEVPDRKETEKVTVDSNIGTDSSYDPREIKMGSDVKSITYKGAYKRRGQRGRGQFAQAMGATEASENAVDLGLAWLAKVQNEDGHWDNSSVNSDESYDKAIDMAITEGEAIFKTLVKNTAKDAVKSIKDAIARAKASAKAGAIKGNARAKIIADAKAVAKAAAKARFKAIAATRVSIIANTIDRVKADVKSLTEAATRIRTVAKADIETAEKNRKKVVAKARVKATAKNLKKAKAADKAVVAIKTKYKAIEDAIAKAVVKAKSRAETAAKKEMGIAARRKAIEDAEAAAITDPEVAKRIFPRVNNHNHAVGTTGLAILAFLGAGHTHKNVKSEYRDNVKRAIDWLISQQGENGGFRQETYYEQGTATMAICEAYGMTEDKTFRDSAQRALNHIVLNMGPDGGYGYDGPGDDTHVTSFQVMALKSGILAGLIVPKDITQKLLDYYNRALETDGTTGYTSSKGRFTKRNYAFSTRTAVGLFSRMFLGVSPKDPNAQKIADVIHRVGPQIKNVYQIYDGTYGMFQMGGHYWRNWNDRFRDQVIALQVKEGDNKGSWGKGSLCVVITSLYIMSLEVYYRYLPVNQ